MIFKGSRKMRLAVLIYFAVLRWTLWREMVRVTLGQLAARSFSASDEGDSGASSVCGDMISTSWGDWAKETHFW